MAGDCGWKFYDEEVFDDFLQLCEQGNVDRVDEFMEKNAIDIAMGNNDDTNGLHIASANGHDALVGFLLGRGAPIDGSNMYGWTPLMQAARHGHTRTVELLLKHGARPELRNRLGATALVCAVRSGHVSTVRAFLETCHGTEHKTDEVTSLMVAAQLGHDPIVRLLLESGFDVNESTHTVGLTPLVMAVTNGHKRTAQMLVERGANLDAKTKIGSKTALDVAISRGRRHVRSYLEQKMAARKQEGNTKRDLDLFDAIEKGDFGDVLTILANDGLKVNETRPETGATPLMFAAHHGHLSIVRLLVERGARVDVRDKVRGCTALMEALFSGNNDVASYLIESGADVNLKASRGLTAFNIATIVDAVDSELITLLAKRANCERPSQSGISVNESDLTCARRKKMTQTTAESDSFPPLSSPLSASSSMFHNVPDGIRMTPGSVVDSSFRTTIECETGPSFALCSASPCRMAIRKTPKRPDPPLMPSLSLDASNMGHLNMSMSRNQFIASTNEKDTRCCVLLSQRELKDSSSDEKRVTDASNEAVAIEDASVEDNLLTVLKKCSLERHESVFSKEEVDLEAFRLLTESDLRDLGIDSPTSIRKLLDAIHRLNTN